MTFRVTHIIKPGVDASIDPQNVNFANIEAEMNNFGQNVKFNTTAFLENKHFNNGGIPLSKLGFMKRELNSSDTEVPLNSAVIQYIADTKG